MPKMSRAQAIGSKMIKTIIKIFLNFLNHFMFFGKSDIKLSSSKLLFLKIRTDKTNRINLKHSYLSRTTLKITGRENLIQADYASLERCDIVINGESNVLIVEKGAKLRKANVIIRGSGNTIKIGKATTFGTVRMINVGKENIIEIGENCLFSDYIEIWASDTHSIYDRDGNFINPEQPVSIGDCVWVGSHVTILKGVNIGDGAIIGMNSMVTKNIESHTVNVGNPLRVIKRDITWSNAYAPLCS